MCLSTIVNNETQGQKTRDTAEGNSVDQTSADCHEIWFKCECEFWFWNSKVRSFYVFQADRTTAPTAFGSDRKSTDTEVRSFRDEINRLRAENVPLEEAMRKLRIRAGESGARTSSSADILEIRNSSPSNSNAGLVAGQDVETLISSLIQLMK